ncbi:hypothetical protein [Rheinheimera sp. F8]|uniref:hypothetical protein n=1 Tax=Rheinheimera sp. F8 TaxID=1763998 RepID=UPI000AD4E3CA|nr:hypothetical protein [Rheinheimera sp. F8]
MSAIPFTARELKRAWRELSNVANTENRENPHRLLMFYAVECGLKAVWLKRNSREVFDKSDIDKTGHDLRQLLRDLRVGSKLDLPSDLRLEPFTQSGVTVPRTGDIRILHQAWRYGGKCSAPSDHDCERQLQNVLNWIQGELK